VAFMSAVVASTSEAAANKVVRKGNGFQVEQSLVSKKISNPGGIVSKEENRSGRPVPGSSSFVRLNRVDPSTAQVKKLLSGDYLTFYMGNLSYRANDVTLKTAIENRFPITVDQAVVAYSSDGRSRGCAFVTVRWKEYLNSFSDPNSQSLVQKFCHSLTGKPLFGRPVFVELACNQRRGG
jgi:RNA recognition motif-containing protein